MEQNAYLVMRVNGIDGVCAVGLAFPRTTQILDAMAGASATAAPFETIIESEIRILPFDALSSDQRLTVTIYPSTPFLASEMPARLPGG